MGVDRAFFGLGCIFALAAFACGSGTKSSSEPKGPSEIEVRTGALQRGSLSAPRAIAASATVDRLGAGSGGQILAVAAGQVFVVGDDRLELRALFRQDDDPTSLGQVRAIAPRNAGGAWVGADAGVFVLEGLYVTKERLVTGMGAVRDLVEITAGPLQGLWLATDDGLFRRQTDRFDRYTVPMLPAGISGIAVEQGGSAALVLAGGEVALLEPSGSTIKSDRPPLDAGTIYAVAGGSGALYAASERGLLRWRPGASPRWVRFTLAPEGSPPEKTFAVTVDPMTGNAWARISRGLVRLNGDSPTLYDGTGIDGDAMELITIDRNGDVWLSKAESLFHLTTGSALDAVTFRGNVKPWIDAHCAECHRNQTLDFDDYRTFSEKAEMALTRVRMGDMPRCSGGLPCPPGQRLKMEEYSILEQWIRNGKPE